MHLIIIQNGLNGFSFLMNYVLNYYITKLGDGYHVCVSNVNDFLNTHDGLDTMGLRLGLFVQNKIACLKNCDKISFIGHSLGGLMIRSCIKYLHDIKLFDIVKPIAYISIATPHLGIYEVSEWRKIAARWLLRTTGTQLLGEDITLFENEKPMLWRLSSPEYTDSLNLFQFKLAYGVIDGDSSVPFQIACLTKFTTYHIMFIANEKSPNIINLDEFVKERSVELDLKDGVMFKSHPKFPIEMYEDLNKIQWIKKGVFCKNWFSTHLYVIGRGWTKHDLVLEDTLQYLREKKEEINK